MQNRKVVTIAAALLFMAIAPTQALTFKSGEVLGADGKIYQGASPEVAANIAKAAQEEDFFGNKKTAGVVGKSVFIVVEDQTVFVPLTDIVGKSDEEITAVITNYIVDALTADLVEFHSAGGASAADADAAVARDLKNIDLANDPFTKQMAAEAASVAAVDADKAIALINARIALAVVDVSNEAARAGAEAAFETALEAAQDAVNGMDEGLREQLNDPNAVFDADGNYLGDFDQMCANGEISGC